ncbi:hypothetical protein [Persicitalea jodogahamensis]|uniref:hypothetical protein n=1 Tax=Persicitalea jodogahamensis TaxID=402147 RepID=UPI001678E2F6|nr:hypothetical protein [Persicitalea jodogahamensis]
MPCRGGVDGCWRGTGLGGLVQVLISLNWVGAGQNRSGFVFQKRRSARSLAQGERSGSPPGSILPGRRVADVFFNGSAATARGWDRCPL